MSNRKSLFVTSLGGLVFLLMACPSASTTGKDAGSNTVTTDGGSKDAGTDAGPVVTTTDGGNENFTIAQARSATFCTQLVKLKGVVVTAVDDTFKGAQGDYSAQFWVTDPAKPSLGLFVDKYFTDMPGAYEPKIGDVLDIEGYLQSVKKFEDRDGYRLVLKSQFGCAQPNTGKLSLTLKGTMVAPVDNTVPSDFGDAQGGAVKANPEFLGSRVYIQGPLTLTEPNPTALKRVSLKDGDQVHFGFEVTGGILVNNRKTYGATQDGGSTRCDFRAMALDGGTVTFPTGIRGVWETYTHAPCVDGGTSPSCFRDAGFIPGTDQNYTNVLYPQDCETDFANAEVQ